jgi:glycosyltransferase involved in cell wall biosynthesis
MRVALVTSSYFPRQGPLERHVHELATGLTRRRVEVEVLTQDVRQGSPSVSEFDGFVVRRFAALNGNFPISPGLWNHLRRTSGTFDVVHVHGAQPSFVLAAARGRPARFLFTPHVPVSRLLRWPYMSMMRSLIRDGAEFLCTAAAETDFLKRKFPAAADQFGVVPHGVDVAAIEAARPFDHVGVVVLTVGRLEAYKRTDRAIAALAALDPIFRLAVVGSGPAHDKLLAHAADLKVSSRVNFAGAVPESELYRWLRTASVVVALAEHASSGVHVTEAVSAGCQVIASDIPVHRDAASHGRGSVRFVASAASPLDVAHVVSEAARSRTPKTLRLAYPTWEQTVDSALAAYTRATPDAPSIAAVQASAAMAG